MKKLLLFSTVLLLLSCGNSKTDSVSFSWIEGNWQGNLNDSMLVFENWKPNGKDIYKGLGGMCIHNDTVFAERISIFKKDGSYYYSADVQENETAIDFKFMGEMNDSVIFENKEHDFPQRIVYYYKTSNKLYAYIDGIVNNKYRKEIFEYTKK